MSRKYKKIRRVIKQKNSFARQEKIYKQKRNKKLKKKKEKSDKLGNILNLWIETN